MTADPFDWPLFLRKLDAREHYWNARRITYPRPDAVPFMPYSMQLFAALLMDAVMNLPGRFAYDPFGRTRRARFLDVGCGPGTKMQLAEQLFSLDVRGIDIVPEFIAEARSYCLDAEVADAFDYADYDQAAIVLVNRPSGLQDDLEKLVMSRMAPGALLIAINWRNEPGRAGWRTISQEYGEPVRGVWAKPDGVDHYVGLELTGPTRCCGVLPASLPPDDSLTPDLDLVTCKAHPPLGIDAPVKLHSYGPDHSGIGHISVQTVAPIDLGDDPDGDNTPGEGDN